MAGVLFIVPTPIGNLEDITLRALRILKEVDLIAAEDTRHTKHLIEHYGIKTMLTSYHEHNEREKAFSLIRRLEAGATVALVSDAGTPAISDPGYRLVVEAIRAGIQIIPLPGAAAVTTALCASGLPTDRFLFCGFLPAKKSERRAKLAAVAGETATLAFYEAPHRSMDSLNDIRDLYGEREVVVARELTKLHEEFLRGTVSHVLAQLEGRELKGEIVLLIHGASADAMASDSEIKAELRALLDQGMGVKELAELLGERHHRSKRQVYQLALELKGAKK